MAIPAIPSRTSRRQTQYIELAGTPFTIATLVEMSEAINAGKDVVILRPGSLNILELGLSLAAAASCQKCKKELETP